MSIDTPNVITPHGLVDRSALEALRASYDTWALLRGVEAIDDLDRDLRREEGVRDQLLQLHAMANTVLNGAGLAGPAHKSLPNAAEELMERLGDAGELILNLTRLVAPLAGLTPNDDPDA